MEKKSRPKLTLPPAAKGKSRAQKVAIALPGVPIAYVMPEEPQLTDEEYLALSEDERQRHVDRNVRRWGLPDYDWGSDPLQDAIELDEFDQMTAGMDDEEFFSGAMTDIDKAALPAMAAAEHADFIKQTPHDPVPYGVEIGGQDAALKQLLLAVAVEVNRWRKPPKAEATAAGIGLAIAQIRGERGVKHPRDIAKEVKVRAQTLHQIKNVALGEIQRLSLAQAFRNEEAEETGTYNQNEGEEDQDDEPQFLLP